MDGIFFSLLSLVTGGGYIYFFFFFFFTFSFNLKAMKTVHKQSINKLCFVFFSSPRDFDSVALEYISEVAMKVEVEKEREKFIPGIKWADCSESDIKKVL